MNWHVYPIIFQIKSQLLIGWRKIGNLNQTRLYVPGKVVWAALTARLARNGFKELENEPVENPYQRTGSWLKKNARFTYLFPALKNEVNATLYPKSTKTGMVFGKDEIPKSEIQYLLLDSYASTALDYSFRSSEEGSLHETEYIRPRSRPLKGTSLQGKLNDPAFDELGAPVHLVGYLILKDEISEQIKITLNQLQFGGERRYGWGRACLVNDLANQDTINKLFDNWEIDNSSNDKLVIKNCIGGYLPAHALANQFIEQDLNSGTHDPVDETKISGKIEPVVGRETRDSRFSGRSISQARICWQPGSAVSADFKAVIGDYGILES
ncbi:MAG: hypothetical protein GF353_13825 [Candidatus Lokiarchaeota archaeon]|nr:hypothetical protein [Candidatus Lokiarchaeota archaeon]